MRLVIIQNVRCFRRLSTFTTETPEHLRLIRHIHGNNRTKGRRLFSYFRGSDFPQRSDFARARRRTGSRAGYGARRAGELAFHPCRAYPPDVALAFLSMTTAIRAHSLIDAARGPSIGHRDDIGPSFAATVR